MHAQHNSDHQNIGVYLCCGVCVSVCFVEYTFLIEMERREGEVVEEKSCCYSSVDRFGKSTAIAEACKKDCWESPGQFKKRVGFINFLTPLLEKDEIDVQTFSKLVRMFYNVRFFEATYDKELQNLFNHYFNLMIDRERDTGKQREGKTERESFFELGS